MGLGIATLLAWGEGTPRSNVWLVVSLLYHVTRGRWGCSPREEGFWPAWAASLPTLWMHTRVRGREDVV